MVDTDDFSIGILCDYPRSGIPIDVDVFQPHIPRINIHQAQDKLHPIHFHNIYKPSQIIHRYHIKDLLWYFLPKEVPPKYHPIHHVTWWCQSRGTNILQHINNLNTLVLGLNRLNQSILQSVHLIHTLVPQRWHRGQCHRQAFPGTRVWWWRNTKIKIKNIYYLPIAFRCMILPMDYPTWCCPILV